MSELFCLASVLAMAILMSAGADLPPPQVRASKPLHVPTSLQDVPVELNECGRPLLLLPRGQESPPLGGPVPLTLL